MDSWQEILSARMNYWTYVVLMMVGLYAMIAKNNLIKKLIGMGIFQSAIILFYVSVSVKDGATIPIIPHHADHGSQPAQVEHAGAKPDHGPHAVTADHGTLGPDRIANPLPHVLMLTAIVVGVATLGVGLAIVQKIHRDYDTIEEDELLARMRAEADAEEAAARIARTGGDG